ncbi:MAG: hypothetical protein V7L11_14020 [Nostoc sp.]
MSSTGYAYALVSSRRLEMQLKSGRAASSRGGSPKDEHSQSPTGNEAT